MSILLHCPLNAAYPRLYAKALTGLFEQDWPEPYEIVYGVSTGATDARLDRLGKIERAAEMALSGGFDGLLVVEYDVMVPKDALRRLVEKSTDALAVSAVTVSAKWPHDWQDEYDSGCILYWAEALRQDDWPDMGLYRHESVPDLYCGRMSLDDGGKTIWPDPDEETRVRIEYQQPQKAPATVPYSKTLLAKELA